MHTINVAGAPAAVSFAKTLLHTIAKARTIAHLSIDGFVYLLIGVIIKVVGSIKVEVRGRRVLQSLERRGI